MTDALSDGQSHLAQQLFLEPTRREKLAWLVAAGGVACGILGLGTVLALLPLKQTQAYLTIVDRDTGLAARAVEVERATMEHADAVRQSLLYAYVLARETYDPNDNEARMLRAFRQSQGDAQASLQRLWDGKNPNFPPTLYGDTGRVKVEVLQVTPVNDTTAQVRFVKTLSQPNQPDRLGNFTATVTYQFLPTQETALELVWQNPFGFVVTGYRVSADALEAQQDD
ncbi:virB8 family protein [Paracoccus laeviglucosivorans]|uniref:Type IV secretory pathway, component VirB8 n=1 Tax=Paracoccus laeviglucosivorans TaxID=1197861 RepID=A0A521FSR7_9RHOB|nr:type IV secretion system protein [Paracoccus laeviglucosivorans]SMO99166.1 Type IV secretory pathway, component VirB8 [Paracoccus laeviglucosivorans]